MQKVVILDTSILCVWLQVPGKETCGQAPEIWDKQRVDQSFQVAIQQGTQLVLPLATIIETGNHIAQANSRRYELAQALAKLMMDAADEKSPWAAFTRQQDLWSAENLKKLAIEWPNLAVQGTSIGDATIKAVADFYAERRFDVEIWTGDRGLKAYEPPPSIKPPRRRRNQM